MYVTPNDIIKVLREQDGYADQKISSKAVGKILRQQLKCIAPQGTTSRIGSLLLDPVASTAKWYEIFRVNVKNIQHITVFDIAKADIV